MIRILITGKGSYIGSAFLDYMNSFDCYQVEELDVQDNKWKLYDFQNYDVVYHVAGIAHIKETEQNKHLYEEINCNLTYAIAKKAQIAGVKQFIFMSSMSVYGLVQSREGINGTTKLRPNTYYGKSKLKAEQLLQELESETFIVAILRPPMVYGKESPGNLSKLFKVVKKIRVFPQYYNQRSSISINKLLIEVKRCIDYREGGIKLPQNDFYMCTYEIVKQEMQEQGIRVYYTKAFNGIIKILTAKNNMISKIFGDLKYDK